MNSASLIFGLIISTLIGALFHLWRDGGFWRLLLYLFLSAVGFFLGNLIFNGLNLPLPQLGGLNIVGASLGSVAMLLIGHWLTSGASQNGYHR